jgi:hypothetical protein
MAITKEKLLRVREKIFSENLPQETIHSLSLNTAL